MLLSLSHNFLFIHIAKTGGTSIRAALRRYKYRDPYLPLFFICSRISAISGHRLGCKIPRHAKAIAAYEMLPRELYNKLFKFIFIRNPWDLQVSSYHHIRRERPHLLNEISSFEQFIKWKLSTNRTYQYHLDTSIELQSEYITDLKGNVIVDYIGRYESLKEDFRAICRRINIQPPKLPRKRQAKQRETYHKYYNAETAQLVAEYFKRDIEMFGYSF